MMQAEMECDQLQQDMILVEKHNREEAEAVRSARHNKTPIIMKKFAQRLLAAGWARWSGGADLRKRKADTAELILGKVRRRYVS